jgi:hypothetical protein
VEPYNFRFIERRLANAGLGLADADLMDTLWDQVKARGYCLRKAAEKKEGATKHPQPQGGSTVC